MGRPPKCRNCVSFARAEDGSFSCARDGRPLSPECKAQCGGEHFSRCSRHVDPKRLSQIRREAAAKRKVHAGGRPPSVPGHELASSPVRIYADDRSYLTDLAWRMKTSIPGAVHAAIEAHRSMRG